MKDRALPTLIVVALLVMSWFVYDLRSEVQHLQFMVRASQNQAANVANALRPSLLQIQQNQVSASAGLHYLELLLEGLVRHDSLPLEQAREAFKQRRGGVPSGWSWNTPWETTAPAERSAPK